MIKTLISVLFPQKCVGCGDIISEDELLCDYCYEMLERCMEDKLCIKCGLPIKGCQCKNRVFHFDGCIAPFYNTTVAARAMYAFKFHGKQMYARFFAENMALAVKQCYGGIDFDCICAVPLSQRSEMRRGYNQSRLLAQGLADILRLPLAEPLTCKHKRRNQHDLGYAERFENVKGIYRSEHALNNKTVLLVDDIKTTGATLDECARQLLSAGALRVYCVTGLMTYKEYKKGQPKKNSVKSVR